MKAKEWRTCADPAVSMQHLLRRRRNKPTYRKWCLLVCACCRRLWNLLDDPRSKEAIQVFEKHADGMETDARANRAFLDAYAAQTENHGSATWAVELFTTGLASCKAGVGGLTIPYALQMAAHAAGKDEAGVLAERSRQADLVRRIFGNPFRPYPAPPASSANVIGLAQALYDGDDNRLILADALEEMDHAELAAHFRQEEWHPKGCWAVDMILGKT